MTGGRLAVEIVRWAVGFVLVWRMPVPPREIDDDEPVSCSVVVPARDEAHNLRALLPAAVAQAREVIVVDDSSGDGTAEVARELGATVIVAPEPPSGWLGKPWACRTGAAVATYDPLVFLDADVTVEDGGIARIVGAQRRHGGLVSLQPWHDIRRPYEALSAFPNLVAVMGVGAFTILGRRVRPRGAFGPCVAIDRSTYERIGRHDAVKGEVVEDVALARRADRVTLFGGRGVLRYRMYPNGLRSLWNGWTRSLASGATATHPAVLVLVIMWISGVLQAPFTAWWLVAAYAAQLWWVFRPVGRFGVATAALHPVPLLFFLAVFVWSNVRTFVAGEVTWRGRVITTRRR